MSLLYSISLFAGSRAVDFFQTSLLLFFTSEFLSLHLYDQPLLCSFLRALVDAHDLPPKQRSESNRPWALSLLILFFFLGD